MAQVSRMGQGDPLTGNSTLFSPQAKLAIAVMILFLSFFSLAQSLRLFIHFSFFVRAARYCADQPELYSEATAQMMFGDAYKTCLRAQTYMSVGFRFMYCWIPFIFWLMGGCYLLGSTMTVVFALYHLDII